MSKRDFIESPEWQALRATVQSAIAGFQAEMLVANDILVVKEFSGRIKSCQDFLALPDKILKDESEKLLNEQTDVVSLTPTIRRIPTRVF